MKNGKIMFCSISAILLLCGFTWGISNNVVTFKGKDNAEIKVLVSNPHDYRNNNNTSYADYEEVEVGQIIINNGIKEVVFAVGENGSYITEQIEE